MIKKSSMMMLAGLACLYLAFPCAAEDEAFETEITIDLDELDLENGEAEIDLGELFADEGYDIVCSAVSTAVQMTASFLIKFHEADVEFSVNEQEALIELKCKNVFEQFDRQLSVLDDFSIQLSEQYSDYFTFDYLEV